MVKQKSLLDLSFSGNGGQHGQTKTESPEGSFLYAANRGNGRAHQKRILLGANANKRSFAYCIRGIFHKTRLSQTTTEKVLQNETNERLKEPPTESLRKKAGSSLIDSSRRARMKEPLPLLPTTSECAGDHAASFARITLRSDPPTFPRLSVIAPAFERGLFVREAA